MQNLLCKLLGHDWQYVGKEELAPEEKARFAEFGWGRAWQLFECKRCRAKMRAIVASSPTP
jgi:hypothetical protein